MKKNVGSMDKAVRISIAIILLTLVLIDLVNGILAIVFIIASIALVVTSLVSFCGIYTLFGINTCKIDKPKS
jgi:hypothetical protein